MASVLKLKTKYVNVILFPQASIALKFLSPNTQFSAALASHCSRFRFCFLQLSILQIHRLLCMATVIPFLIVLRVRKSLELKGEMCPRRSKIEFYCQVSQHLLPIVALILQLFSYKVSNFKTFIKLSANCKPV